MKEFAFFFRKGDVKKQSPDGNLSKATFKDRLERLELSKGLFKINLFKVQSYPRKFNPTP